MRAAVFHLSIFCADLSAARAFYGGMLGLEEKRATTTSVHFDFFGHQLTLHEIPGFSAADTTRMVDGEEVPVPHFGAAMDRCEFARVAQVLKEGALRFLVEPKLRFVGTPHEQWVLFVQDPTGHGIELKAFTRAEYGEWK